MIEEFYSAYEYSVGSLSILLNSVLLYCVKDHTPNEMKEMSFLLGNIALGDLVLGILGFLTQFRQVIRGNVLILLSNGPIGHWNPTSMSLVTAVYLAAFNYSTIALAYNFFYRYKVVCRYIMKWFSFLAKTGFEISQLYSSEKNKVCLHFKKMAFSVQTCQAIYCNGKSSREQ